VSRYAPALRVRGRSVERRTQVATPTVGRRIDRRAPSRGRAGAPRAAWRHAWSPPRRAPASTSCSSTRQPRAARLPESFENGAPDRSSADHAALVGAQGARTSRVISTSSPSKSCVPPASCAAAAAPWVDSALLAREDRRCSATPPARPCAPCSPTRPTSFAALAWFARVRHMGSLPSGGRPHVWWNVWHALISTTVRLEEEGRPGLAEKLAPPGQLRLGSHPQGSCGVVASSRYYNRPPSHPLRALFESTDTKLGDESELFSRFSRLESADRLRTPGGLLRGLAQHKRRPTKFFLSTRRS